MLQALGSAKCYLSWQHETTILRHFSSKIGSIKTNTLLVMYEIPWMRWDEIWSYDTTRCGMWCSCECTNPDMNLHMSTDIVHVCVCQSVADCEAYLYATAGPVVSRAAVAWVVKPERIKGLQQRTDRNCQCFLFFTTLWMELQCMTKKQCFAGKEKSDRNWKSLWKTSLFTARTASQSPESPDSTVI